jgi:serine/threonine-protein kinase RsbW
VVEISVPADVAYVATLRLAAAGLGSRCDLTVDDIEDLRLAVDEACSLLLPHSRTGTVIHARFTLAAGQLTVVASVDSPDSSAASPDRTGFAWSVLSALASEVEVTGADGRLSIAVTKRREVAVT